MKTKIALGGGCHWCTEAVFQSLYGVDRVEQGYIASIGEHQTFSEAVIVHFNTEIISLKSLIEIHLLTHNSTSNHSMRKKYRSAVYAFSKEQKAECERLLGNFQRDYNDQLITKVLTFSKFRASREDIQNYYLKDPEKPFCKSFISPKLEKLKDLHAEKLKVKTT
ncbi:peptide-methionine (S)-S-oxide reductase [Winogradskyella ursingii]|uniref:peptide-methionine (S)-S-oxide reductase n=1 Tax=Winogradskyella ursingii TaxID=2686079 RepID=UPI0015C6C6D1|nr:peptide-methionine (S)-S-oxide reductase [Winogradskyella ursingii]